MRNLRPLTLFLSALLVAGVRPGLAQYSVGLYRNGKLVTSLGPVAPSRQPAAKSPSVQAPAGSAGSSPIAPAISAEAQVRNKVFADSAQLGLQIQELVRSQTRSHVSAALLSDDAQKQMLSLEQLLIAKQAEVHAAYDQIAAHVLELKLPPEIFQRHLDAVAANEAAFTDFTNTLHEALSEKPGLARRALEKIGGMKLQPNPALKAGPTHQAMTIVTAPQSTDEASLAPTPMSAGARSASRSQSGPSALTSPPNSLDLAETPDVQLTTAIRAKAASLGNNPLAIYEFVRNSVKYQPYLGSRKGAHFTLQQLAGNDTDQASLLIALLRAAGIPCRYVRGTVEMTPAQVTSWLGVDDVPTAGSILATAGLNATFHGSNVRSTHVWVEAYIPYSNYRGVLEDQSGATWIPLAPSFKETTITQGQDVLAAMGFNADSYLANYVSTYRSNSPVETLVTNVQAFLNTNQPGKQVSAVERRITTESLRLGLLPASLPVSLVSSTSPVTALDDTNRFKIRFNLYNGGTTFINYTTNLCQLVGHEFTISYVGATSNDEAVINAHGGIYQTPPYLVSVKPVLKLDGVVIFAATNSLGMGYQHNSDMYFTQPAGANNVQPSIQNFITAGNSQAIGFDTFLDVPNLFAAVTNSNTLLEHTLNATALDYLSRVDRGEDEANRLLRMVNIVDVSEAILESSLSVTYSFGGVPQTFSWEGMTVDADRRIMGPFAVDGDSSKFLPYMKLTGYDGSYMENKVFEATYGQRAVSTIRILQWTRDQGIPTCYISNSISTACPGFSHSSGTLSAVNSALANGHIVIIPQRDFTIGHWSGTGYIDMNPLTGAAGYIISGGFNGEIRANGGSTVDVWPIDLGCSPSGDVVGDIFPDNFNDGDVLCPDYTQLSYSVVLDYDCQDSQGNVQHKTFSDSHTIPLSTMEMVDQFGAGEYTISIPDADVSTVSFTLVDVESLEPDSGAEVDDGDNDPDTRLFVVPISKSAGDIVTVTAVSDPPLALDELPSCWSLSGGNGTSPVERTLDQTAVAKVVFTCKSGSRTKTTTLLLFDIEMITPSGDPIGAPSSSGDGQNQFTFDSSAQGVLTMSLKAKVTPSGAADYVKDLAVFDVDSIGGFFSGSSLSWTDPLDQGGTPKAVGDFLEATVTFTGLPASNSDFGRKKASISFKTGWVPYFGWEQMDEKDYAVLFSRDAANHPGGTSGDPNWFYYWQDGGVCGIDNLCAYSATAQFGYTLPGHDNIMRLGPLAPTANDGENDYTAKNPVFGKIKGTGKGKGIKCVAETIRHERHHLELYNQFGYVINHGSTADDSDGDVIKNTSENICDGVATDPGDPDTFDLFSTYGDYNTYGDDEVRCRVLELNLNITIHPENDWANPGCQSKNKNGP